MKIVFYIEKEKFLRQMVEESLKLSNVQGHCFESGENLSYFYEDLNPEVLLVDLESLEGHLEQFLGHLAASSCAQIPVVFIGSENLYSESGSPLEDRATLIQRPLSPTALLEILFPE